MIRFLLSTALGFADGMGREVAVLSGWEEELDDEDIVNDGMVEDNMVVSDVLGWVTIGG